MTTDSVLRLLLDVRRASKGGAEAIAQRQRVRFAAIVAYARASSPYYRELYKNVPGEIDDPATVPVTDKQALMARFDEWSSDRDVTLDQARAFAANPDLIGERFLGRYTLATTSGTTGTPGIFIIDDGAMRVTSALALRMIRSWVGVRDVAKVVAGGRRLAMVADIGHHSATSVAAARLLKSPSRRKKVQLLSVRTPLPELVAQLNEFQPALLAPYASMARLMASEQEAGRLRIRPVLTVLAAEGLPLREYDRIAEVFATKLGNSYAATECPFLSYSCQHHWLHVNADWVVIEPVDAHYRPVAPGTQSHTVLVTSLERKLSRLGVSPEELEGFRKGADPNAASRSAVTAPFAGVVTEVHAAPGELINPERELFTVADLSRVWLQADVYQKDIAKIRVGQDAQVTVDAYPGETFTGRVTHISDVLDAGTRTAKVRCEVANRDGRLKHQMFATLALPVSALRESIVIPATSVQDIDGVPTVFVRIDEEHFETRPVRIGSAFSGSVEVAEGLKTGERVVTEGALMLKSKLKLRVEEEEGEKK